MPTPFAPRDGDDPGRDLGAWDDTGNIRIPGNLTCVNLVYSGTITTPTGVPVQPTISEFYTPGTFSNQPVPVGIKYAVIDLVGGGGGGGSGRRGAAPPVAGPADASPFRYRHRGSGPPMT